MRNYWGKIDLQGGTPSWRARVWPEQGLVDSITYRPVVVTEALLYTTVKENAEAELRQLVDMDGQIIWVRGPREESKDMDDEWDEYDAREANERADEAHELNKHFESAALHFSGIWTCKRCGCLVSERDRHRWQCGAHVNQNVDHVQDLVIAIQRTLGIKPHGDQWQTVADRLRWINQRLEMVTRELGITHRGPSDAPGGPEAQARAQRTLDDDWAGWGVIQREASKRLGQAIDRYLKGEK